MDEIAIRVEQVQKRYKLYEKPSDRIREAFGFSKKKRYKEHFALKDVSFTVKKGETVGLIGTNGSGKSTMLKIITGVLHASSGSVQVDGRISALLELGAGFNMEYTGIENVYLNGMMIGFTNEEIDNRLEEILAFADIGEFAYQPVKTYSSGMFIRLAFAVAINIDPEILIVDEALSVGDVFFQAKCYKKFEEFRRMGKTILIVSHDLGSISKYCDKVVLLNKGQKVAEGIPNKMIDLYKKVLTGNIVNAPIQAAGGQIQDMEKAGRWQDRYSKNPQMQEYGDKLVEILDFAVIDHDGTYTDTLYKNKIFQIRIKIRANCQSEDPVVAFTIRDLKGTEITGTNTMFEKKVIGRMLPQEERVVTFLQNMSIQGGQYLLSVGCTRYEADEFLVYHRLYDVCSLTVISHKNTVGFYDMDSVVTIE